MIGAVSFPHLQHSVRLWIVKDFQTSPLYHGKKNLSRLSFVVILRRSFNKCLRLCKDGYINSLLILSHTGSIHL